MYKERITLLLNAIDNRYPHGAKGRSDAINVVEVGLELFPRCAGATYSKNITLDMAKLQVDAAVYSHMKKDLNDSNIWLYTATLKAIKDINQLCEHCRVEHLYDGDMDAESIERFCGEIVSEYFNDRA